MKNLSAKMDNRLFSPKDDLGDSFLSDMDDDPVDMEEIREGMKLVPLPDMYSDMGKSFPCFDDIMKLHTNVSEDPYKPSEEDQSHSGEDGLISGRRAKVGAPDALTVVESLPPPDFSCWTVEDDLLLKNAMEVGAAMEALAKGAMRFSRRYTVRELRARWRALLYDPEISSKASIRMVEAEAAFLESMRLMFPDKQKLHDFVHKRRQKSVRDTFYTKKRDSGTPEKSDSIGMPLGDSDMLFDPDDQAFSQMVDLLAAGGIGAVIGACSEMDSDGIREEYSDDIKDEVAEVKDEDTLEGLKVVGEKHMDSVKDVVKDEIVIDSNLVESSNVSVQQTCEQNSKDVEPEKPEKNSKTPPRQQYVVVSSDEEDDNEEGLLPEPKRQKTGNAVVQEKFTCTLNTQETDIPAFSGILSSPSSEHGLVSSPEDGKGEVTSDVKSSDCGANYNTFHHSYEDELQSVEVASQTTEPEKLTEELPDTVKEKPEMLKEVVKTPVEMAAVTNISEETSSHLEVNEDDKLEPQLVESDTEIPNYSDVEEMILDMDLDPGDNDVSARAESKRLYREHRMTILRLEQSVNSRMQRYLTLKGAIAIFYGRHLEYLMTKNEVFIGRKAQGNDIDIDLGQEGRANKISRKQATIKLGEDGVFQLKNVGKRVLYVNDGVVITGQRTVLTSNCLIEIGGMRYIFEINRRLTHQRVKEMAQGS